MTNPISVQHTGPFQKLDQALQGAKDKDFIKTTAPGLQTDPDWKTGQTTYTGRSKYKKMSEDEKQTYNMNNAGSLAQVFTRSATTAMKPQLHQVFDELRAENPHSDRLSNDAEGDAAQGLTDDLKKAVGQKLFELLGMAQITDATRITAGQIKGIIPEIDTVVQDVVAAYKEKLEGKLEADARAETVEIPETRPRKPDYPPPPIPSSTRGEGGPGSHGVAAKTAYFEGLIAQMTKS